MKNLQMTTESSTYRNILQSWESGGQQAESDLSGLPMFGDME